MNKEQELLKKIPMEVRYDMLDYLHKAESENLNKISKKFNSALGYSSFGVGFLGYGLGTCHDFNSIVFVIAILSASLFMGISFYKLS